MDEMRKKTIWIVVIAFALMIVGLGVWDYAESNEIMNQKPEFYTPSGRPCWILDHRPSKLIRCK